MEALKSAPVSSDENQTKILNLSGAVDKPVTFVMSLLPGMIVGCKTLAEKWKLCTFVSQAAWVMLWKIFWNMKSFKSTQLRSRQRQAAGPEKAVLWKWIFWSVFKQKPGCITSDRKYSVVRANATNCRNWCPATTLGMSFWVWFDLWRLLRETVSKCCSLLEVILSTLRCTKA